MKKKLRIAIPVLLFVLASCVKEKAPSGLIIEQEINTKDTTYVNTTIPAKQAKVILMEEATGVHCSNCPDGSKQIKSLITTNPGRILAAAVYSPFLNEFTPPKCKRDFNLPEFLNLVDLLGGDPSKPSAAIDRLPTAGTLPYFFDQTLWAAKINSLLSKTTPLNIELTSVKKGSEYILKSKITFTENVTEQLAIGLYLIEDGIIDYQNDKNVDVLDYEHNHVLVKILTPVPGSIFLSDMPTKEAGRVFERSFIYNLPTNVANKANCKLLCFVHKTGAEKEVLHAQEVELE